MKRDGMTEEEQLLAYAEYCGITIDELMGYMDCFESRRLVGLCERDMTPQQQMAAIVGRVTD